MRRKALLTAVLCMVLAMASNDVCRSDINKIYAAEETEETQGNVGTTVDAGGENQSTDPPATDPPQTDPPQTDPPQTQAPTEPPTQAPTEPPTQAPTEPPTQAPTEPPTQAPAETQPTEPATQTPTETQPTEPATQAPTETQPTEPATQMPTETQAATPGETNPETGGQTESEPPATDAPQTEPAGETMPTETESETETETETGTEKESEKKSKKESESESEREKISNEELIARQKIVIPPKIEKEFRFTQVEKQYAIVKNPDGASVYEKKSADARAVGALDYYGTCYILEDAGDGWYYVESGNVRGFIEADEVLTGDAAERIVKIRGPETLPQARLLVARTENAAFAYTQTTVQEVIAVREYALASGETLIYEQKNASSRAVGRLADQGLCYILADAESDWIFVESGEARGFVERSHLVIGKSASQKVAEAGEVNLPLAEVLVSPQENKACYYTLTSVKEAAQGARTRKAMVDFAKQFLGNPYVWGGTSLTAGADCSGFVQSIYSYFGYSLPRVAEDQAMYGMQIPISSAEPGDLIFYARNGYVYHVSMYIGDGQVIHASGRKVGIIISGINGNAVWATRVIQD